MAQFDTDKFDTDKEHKAGSHTRSQIKDTSAFAALGLGLEPVRVYAKLILYLFIFILLLFLIAFFSFEIVS